MRILPAAAGVLGACAGDPLAPDANARLLSALRRVSDWKGLGDAAARHGMAALLERRVAAVGPGAVPPEVAAAWKAGARAVALRSLSMQRRLVMLMAAFDDAGVPAMAFKGPALAEGLYGDSTLRRFVDLDVLVPAVAVLPAREVVLRAGYRDEVPLAAAPTERLVDVMQEIVMLPRGAGIPVEIHWREGLRFAAESLPAEELFPRAATVSLLGREVRVPGPLDVALLVAVHAISHDWQRFEDVAAFAAALRGLSAVEQADLEALAASLRCRRRLHLAVLLAMKIAGASPAAGLRAAAGADGGARRLAGLFEARLLEDLDAPGRPTARGGPGVRAAKVLREARALDSPAAAARYAWRRLFTPAVYDWDHAGEADASAAGWSGVLRGAMTQVRRQQRLWSGGRRRG